MVGRYLAPLLELAHGQISGSITLSRDDPLWRTLAEMAATAVRALGAEGRFVAHVEFLSTDDALYVGEVAARAPGAEVPWQCDMNCRVDLERLNLELQMNRASVAPTPGVAASWIWIPGTHASSAHDSTGGEFLERFLGEVWRSTDSHPQALNRRTAVIQRLLSEPGAYIPLRAE